MYAHKTYTFSNIILLYYYIAHKIYKVMNIQQTITKQFQISVAKTSDAMAEAHKQYKYRGENASLGMSYLSDNAHG